jgi:pyridoxal biosynthesis lyase PdxS
MPYWPLCGGTGRDHGKVWTQRLRPLQILQTIGVDYIDESEVLTPADEQHHINKQGFKVPFVCGAKNLGEALRRISEGAAFIRTKGEAGTGEAYPPDVSWFADLAIRKCRRSRSTLQDHEFGDPKGRRNG